MNITDKIKVLVIEDDPTWSLFVESAIFESSYHLIGAANTVAKAKAMIDGYNPDILISDIMLQDCQIFNLMVEEKYRNIPKVFMTSHIEEEVFLRVNQINKSMYLAKPFHKFSLLSSLDTLQKLYPISKPESENYLEIRGKNQQKKKIMFSSITWILAEGNYSFIHTDTKYKFAIKKSLTKIKQELDSRFIQINKASVINTNYIQRIDLGGQSLILNESPIPIGRAFRSELEPFLERKL